MKTANLIINNWFLVCNTTCHNQFKLFSELGKIWKCNLGFKNPSISFRNWRPNFGSVNELGKVLFKAKFSFTVENKWRSDTKKDILILNLTYRWLIDDWDFPFTKVLMIYKWIGKNIFHLEKWNETIGNSAHTIKYLAKRPWRYLFLTYVYKSIVLVNEL